MAERILEAHYRNKPLTKICLGKFILWQPVALAVQGLEFFWQFTDTNGDKWQCGAISTGGGHTLTLENPLDLYWQLFAGAGGGASRHGGGGGAGGTIGDLSVSEPLTAGSYPAFIGLGGNGAPASASANGFKGGDSTFLGNTAIGGGAGASAPNPASSPEINGGCGGGGRGLRTYFGSGSQGFNGAAAGSDNRTGGGGGGQGADGNISYGGTGIDLSSFIGTSQFDSGFVAGGGMGGGDQTDILFPPLGGAGFGGNATNAPTESKWASGGAGGGMIVSPGSSTSENRPGAKGSDGLLIVRWLI